MTTQACSYFFPAKKNCFRFFCRLAGKRSKNLCWLSFSSPMNIFDIEARTKGWDGITNLEMSKKSKKGGNEIWGLKSPKPLWSALGVVFRLLEATYWISHARLSLSETDLRPSACHKHLLPLVPWLFPPQVPIQFSASCKCNDDGNGKAGKPFDAMLLYGYLNISPIIPIYIRWSLTHLAQPPSSLPHAFT